MAPRVVSVIPAEAEIHDKRESMAVTMYAGLPVSQAKRGMISRAKRRTMS